MHRRVLSIILIAYFAIIGSVNLLGQTRPDNAIGQYNPIQTAVPFLNIAPDSRAGALGDAGVANTVDANSQHWNPSKYAFSDSKFGVSLSYSPWMLNLVNDMSLLYLSGYWKIDKRQAVSASLRYFNLGTVAFTDESGYSLLDFVPQEFAVDAAYSLKLTDYLSGGIAFRFIYSNLDGGFSDPTGSNKAAVAGAADISLYYGRPFMIKGRDAEYAFGLNISNIGNKITYSENSTDFLPANLKLGGRFTYNFDNYNKMSLLVDLNKLLVPTSITDETSDSFSEDSADYANTSVIEGLFTSFYDAPGGFDEEMKEIMYSFGLEYWYREQFALRAGYFNESEMKGNRKYFTVGLGVKFTKLGLDFSYLVPTNGTNSPLANTMRITLFVDMNSDVKKR